MWNFEEKNIFETFLLCTSGWSWTSDDPPVLTSWKVGLQACVTCPNCNFCTLCLIGNEIFKMMILAPCQSYLKIMMNFRNTADWMCLIHFSVWENKTKDKQELLHCSIEGRAVECGRNVLKTPQSVEMQDDLIQKERRHTASALPSLQMRSDCSQEVHCMVTYRSAAGPQESPPHTWSMCCLRHMLYSSELGAITGRLPHWKIPAYAGVFSSYPPTAQRYLWDPTPTSADWKSWILLLPSWSPIKH